MYISDKPIYTKDADAFGRVGVAKQLAKALYELNLPDSFVVGLYGAQGPGRT